MYYIIYFDDEGCATRIEQFTDNEFDEFTKCMNDAGRLDLIIQTGYVYN